MTQPETLTPWGYSVMAESVPPIMDPEEFAAMTGGAFAGEDAGRIEAMLDAVSASVRAFCGWHVAPMLPCKAVTEGPGWALCLPSLAVRSVSSVSVLGEALEAASYEWRSDGMVRRRPPSYWPSDWGGVEVSFESGFDLAAVPDLAAVVAQIASNAMAAAPGVRSERAGGVEIEYNQTGSGISGGVGLLPRDMQMLAAYRLPPVPR